jgi:tryptophanyl-tRNA synthetase
MSQKPRFFTGIKPTGTITLGHYLGVIQHILAIQDQYEIIIMIGDLHALTIPNKEFNYREKCYEIASLLYACGLKEENCKVFIQSEIKEHLELAFFLSPHITVGRLGDMIEYKEKKKENETGNLALLSYPVLMAADILLYDSDLVIVGQDQKQHLELTNDLARKFNNFISADLLKVPRFSIPDLGAKIMGLQNPEKKMSKSEHDYISLQDKPETIKKKIASAVTDSENKIYYHPEKKSGISNLLTIYALLNNQKMEEVEKDLFEFNYYQFKTKLITLLNSKLADIQKKHNFFLPKIKELLEKNSSYLKNLAEKKIVSIKSKLKLL